MKDTVVLLLRELAEHLKYDAELTGLKQAGLPVGALVLSTEDGALWKRIIDVLGCEPDLLRDRVAPIIRAAGGEVVSEIKPSDVKRQIFATLWQNSQKETIATNILKLAKSKGDEWVTFTWEEYVDFCSHNPSEGERHILEGFVSTGYLKKDERGAYGFTRKIIGVYMQYCD